MRFRHLAIIFFFISLAKAGRAAAPDAPSETRIIDSFSQLGIDTAMPRFGWVVNDADRGERETAYEIVVAAQPMKPDDPQPALWDSGKVASDQQYGIPYAGPMLARMSEYWWKVRTWDKDDQVSPWSSPQRFITAVFAPGEWNAGAQWIRLLPSPDSTIDPPPLFRKTFTIAKPVKHAFLYISGLGQFVAILNGAKIGDHEIDPAWTDYAKTIDYVTFDVTSQLQPGVNALGVMLGNGWFGNKGMKLWGQLHLEYSDGTSSDIGTDPSWKASTSPFTATEVHGSETYDARLEQPGWNTGAFDDSKWSNAMAATATSGSLVSQNSPPVLARQTLSPVKVTTPAPGIDLYDFGQNINGIYEITVQGKAGALIKIVPGEALSKSRVKHSNTAGSTYILKGGASETWRLTFSSIGFRYLEIRNVSRDASQTVLPIVQAVKAYSVYTGSREVGSFSASDPRYNQIYQLALHTIRSGLVSIHEDGPNYEKLGWQEVAWTMFPSGMDAFDLQNLHTKITRDLRDSQRAVGLSPNIAPDWFHRANTPPEGPFDDAPAWGASMFMVPWLLYQNYGDVKVLQDNYAAMKAYLAYLKTREQNGLVTYGLGDWMAPGGSTVANVEGAIYVHDTAVVRDAAATLHQTSDATFYGGEYDRVRAAYNNAYFDPKSKSYRPMNQTNQAIPLAFGIVPEGSKAAVVQALVDDIAKPQENGEPLSYGKPGEFGPILPDHVTAGDIGVTFLWRALGEAGQQDLVQRMILQPTGPSYLNMIENGETTIDENWNIARTRSHDHDMYGGIFEWFFRTLGGISPLQPGYAQILFQPFLPTGLKQVTTSYDSVRGIIRSAWKVDQGSVTWEVQIPVNSTARIALPTMGTPASMEMVKESGALIFSDGQPVGKVEGLRYERAEGSGALTRLVWTAGSGSYRFLWQIPPTPPHTQGGSKGF